MAKLLNLPTIETLAASGAYGGYRLLSEETCALLLGYVTYAMNYNIWQGAGYVLTDNEKDTIDAMISQAVSDLLTAKDGDVGDYEKIASVEHTSDVSSVSLSDLDFEGYRSIKILLSGLLSNSSANWVDNIIFSINNITTSSLYYSVGEFVFGDGTMVVDYPGSKPGIAIFLAARSQTPSSGVFGNLEITIYNPNVGSNTHIRYSGMVGGLTTDRIAIMSGSGVYNSTSAVEKVSFCPEVGTNFLVDPEASNEPNELSLAIYGIKE